MPGKIFTFETELWLHKPRAEVFDFFSNARNLQIITPPWLHFEFLSPEGIRMEEGTRLDYRIRLHGLPVRWQSEITAWQPPCRFVDEQRRGPYRVWVHEHLFAAENSGTRARDRVRYAVPGGALINRLFVARDLERIFAHRSRKLEEIFGPPSSGFLSSSG